MLNKYKKYYITVISIILSFLGTMALFNYIVDPYYLWHKKPLWKHNPYLSTNMRLIKGIQGVLRQPNIVIIGSSRIYHSMDTNLLNLPDKTVYNMGISSLSVTEANDYISYLSKWDHINVIVYGLDFFSFDNIQSYPGFNTDINKHGFFIEEVFYSLLNFQSLRNSLYLLKEHHKRHNDWSWYGYRTTLKSPQNIVDYGLKTMQISDYQQPTYFGNDVFNQLQSIINTCQSKHIKLVLFFSPLNYRQQQIIKNAGKWSQFIEWKEIVTSMAQKNHIGLWDFNTKNTITNYPYLTVKEINNNPYYLDSSHYTPLVAKMILQKMGFPVNNPVNIPNDFGIQLSSPKAPD